jgi:hypothetical protein
MLVNRQREQNGWAAWVGIACIALLLAATTAQAVHFCGLPVLGSNGAAQSAQVSSAGAAGSALCLTCLMAQSAAAVLFFITLFPERRRRVVVRVRQVRPRSFLDSFHLYVRPPPTW